jgi:hypothetical protein
MAASDGVFPLDMPVTGRVLVSIVLYTTVRSGRQWKEQLFRTGVFGQLSTQAVTFQAGTMTGRSSKSYKQDGGQTRRFF